MKRAQWAFCRAGRGERERDQVGNLKGKYQGEFNDTARFLIWIGLVAGVVCVARFGLRRSNLVMEIFLVRVR